MKKEFNDPKMEKVEFTVAARLEGSNGDFSTITPTVAPTTMPGGLHDSGNHTACTYTTNSKSAGYANLCKHTNGKNSAGGSGIGSC